MPTMRRYRCQGASSSSTPSGGHAQSVCVSVCTRMHILTGNASGCVDARHASVHSQEHELSTWHGKHMACHNIPLLLSGGVQRCVRTECYAKLYELTAARCRISLQSQLYAYARAHAYHVARAAFLISSKCLSLPPQPTVQCIRVAARSGTTTDHPIARATSM